MSQTNNLIITPFFRFCKVKTTGMNVFNDRAIVKVDQDLRYTPECSHCGSKTKEVHSNTHRKIRDLSMTDKEVWLDANYRKVYCPICGTVRVEKQDYTGPYMRMTKRYERYVFDLCKKLTITEVSEKTGLDWKTIKEIDKRYLEKEYPDTDYSDLRILAIDEISLKKGRKYVTVIINFETGRVIWMGKGRSVASLYKFFRKMPAKIKNRIEAVATDMWAPYIKAFEDSCPNVKIVLDYFHIKKNYNKVLNKIRISEYRRVENEGRAWIKGSRYILLKNYDNLREKEKKRLSKILEVNEMLSTAYILKEHLEQIFKSEDREQVEKKITEWCAMALETDNTYLKNFVKSIRKHEEYILNHCEYPIHTSKLEGINNKLKNIKRHAYGYIDMQYFELKAKQAFPGKSTN